MQQPITSIKMRGYRKRRVAEAILTWHSAKPTTRINPNLVRVVCISDTHNKQPVLPPGDILIHAGDLTENGSFDEIQAGITWLSSQPHRFKIFVAGNHAVLLDEAFLQKYPERRYGQSKTKADLNWGNVIYLEDSHITLHVPVQPVCQQQQSPLTPATRKITVFGSPWTPQYGISAFQYPPAAGADHWRGRLATTKQAEVDDSDSTIVVTHGPPKLRLDRRDFHTGPAARICSLSCVVATADVSPRVCTFLATSTLPTATRRSCWTTPCVRHTTTWSSAGVGGEESRQCRSWCCGPG